MASLSGACCHTGTNRERGEGGGEGEGEGRICGSGVTSLSSHCPGLWRALVQISIRIAFPMGRKMGSIYMI